MNLTSRSEARPLRFALRCIKDAAVLFSFLYAPVGVGRLIVAAGDEALLAVSVQYAPVGAMLAAAALLALVFLSFAVSACVKRYLAWSGDGFFPAAMVTVGAIIIVAMVQGSLRQALATFDELSAPTLAHSRIQQFSEMFATTWALLIAYLGKLAWDHYSAWWRKRRNG
ncbi:hypothetical protein [Sphingosinicella sp. BN140058]|uniref:hypothetical protein n=1 Tax=Sphingosinicella sp. BN140058 TaxID=1892855 RepID=UPI00101125C0|nr:hypothetical protein [Sphingosinicella sp. BN140058]QAY80455.1 hypothetical protein ETR14_27850 [Sphingosinicella sp. BN140058]